MTIIIPKNEKIELPKAVSEKFKGKKIELQVTRGGIFLRPVEDAIRQAKGMLRNSVFSTRQYLKNKKADKAIEQ